MTLVEKLTLLLHPKAQPLAEIVRVEGHPVLRLTQRQVANDTGVLVDLREAARVGLTQWLPDAGQRAVVEAVAKALGDAPAPDAVESKPASAGDLLGAYLETGKEAPVPAKKESVHGERTAKALAAFRRGKQDSHRLKALLGCTTREARSVIDSLLRQGKIVRGPYRGTYRLAAK